MEVAFLSSCPVCGQGLAVAALEEHLERFHVGAAFGWLCGRCRFRGRDFDEIAAHAVHSRHEASLIRRERDRDQELLLALGELQESLAKHSALPPPKQVASDVKAEDETKAEPKSASPAKPSEPSPAKSDDTAEEPEPPPKKPRSILKTRSRSFSPSREDEASSDTTLQASETVSSTRSTPERLPLAPADTGRRRKPPRYPATPLPPRECLEETKALFASEEERASPSPPPVEIVLETTIVENKALEASAMEVSTQDMTLRAEAETSVASLTLATNSSSADPLAALSAPEEAQSSVPETEVASVFHSSEPQPSREAAEEPKVIELNETKEESASPSRAVAVEEAPAMPPPPPPPPVPPTAECSECSISVGTALESGRFRYSGVEEHVEMLHSGQRHLYLCARCPERFTSQQAARRHSRAEHRVPKGQQGYAYLKRESAAELVEAIRRLFPSLEAGRLKEFRLRYKRLKVAEAKRAEKEPEAEQITLVTSEEADGGSELVETDVQVVSETEKPESSTAKRQDTPLKVDKKRKVKPEKRPMPQPERVMPERKKKLKAESKLPPPPPPPPPKAEKKRKSKAEAKPPPPPPVQVPKPFGSTVDRSISCASCSKSVAAFDSKGFRKDSLINHVEKLHSDHETFQCTNCDFASRWRRDVQLHTKALHGTIAVDSIRMSRADLEGLLSRMTELFPSLPELPVKARAVYEGFVTLTGEGGGEEVQGPAKEANKAGGEAQRAAKAKTAKKESAQHGLPSSLSVSKPASERCDECSAEVAVPVGDEWSVASALLEHVELAHLGRGLIYGCSLCQDKFASHQQFARHSLVSHAQPYELRQLLPMVTQEIRASVARLFPKAAQRGLPLSD